MKPGRRRADVVCVNDESGGTAEAWYVDGERIFIEDGVVWAADVLPGICRACRVPYAQRSWPETPWRRPQTGVGLELEDRFGEESDVLLLDGRELARLQNMHGEFAAEMLAMAGVCRARMVWVRPHPRARRLDRIFPRRLERVRGIAEALRSPDAMELGDPEPASPAPVWPGRGRREG